MCAKLNYNVIGLIKKAKVVKNRTQVVFWVDFGINLEIQKLSMTGKVQSTQPAKDSKLVTHIRATMIKSFFKKTTKHEEYLQLVKTTLSRIISFHIKNKIYHLYIYDVTVFQKSGSQSIRGRDSSC